MSDSSADLDGLARFLAEECPECGTPGSQRHLAVVSGCQACAEADPRPVSVPLRNEHAGVLVYDMTLPKWSPPDFYWTPFRNIFRSPKCYQLASGARVHVKPDCRC
jgi:hypothetical protein